MLGPPSYRLRSILVNDGLVRRTTCLAWRRVGKLASSAVKRQWVTSIGGMLVLHAGLHKTGSSAIQEALTRTGKRASFRSISISPPATGAPVLSNTNLAQLAIVSQSQDIIFSSEDLFGSPYNAYRQLPSLLLDLRTGLQHSDVTLVVYLKPQLEWAEKVATQVVQAGGYLHATVLIEDLLASDHFSWIDMHDVVQRLCPRWKLVFRPLPPKTNVVDDFFQTVLQEPADAYPLDIYQNQSMSAWAVQCVREVGRDLTLSERHRLARTVQSLSGQVRRGGPGSLLPRDLQDKLLEFQETEASRLVRGSHNLNEVDVVSFQNMYEEARAQVLPCVSDASERDELMEYSFNLMERLSRLALDPWSPNVVERLLFKVTRNQRDILPGISRVFERTRANFLGRTRSWK